MSELFDLHGLYNRENDLGIDLKSLWRVCAHVTVGDV